MPDTLLNYFPNLSRAQTDQYARMEELYGEWNAKINVISRKDFAQFALHHLLHSLSIAKIVAFKPGTRILDAGTGGGFPGMPLAVMFPEVQFTLVDSIGKKVRVIDTIATELKLTNITPVNARFESLEGSFDFITGRAVSGLPLFASMVKKLVRHSEFNDIPNGILYLTGGDVEKDIMNTGAASKIWRLSDFFNENYFSSKKLVHLFHFN
jgi:16S rRNA (guanine527-N7)-methyltransferase